MVWKFIEKGVDVGLAVRMISEAKKNIELVIIRQTRTYSQRSNKPDCKGQD
jgi:hypothetical protein